MNKNILILSFLLVPFISNSQCTIDKLFLVKHGDSKFKVLKYLQLNDNIELDNQKYNATYWDKPDYLEGDSIYKATLTFLYHSHPCFNHKNVELFFKFADDHLYDITFSIEYQPDEFKECYQVYQSIAEVLKPHFTYTYENEFKRYYGDVPPDESTGEEFTFSDYEGFRENIVETSISYNFEYEYEWNSYSSERVNTGKIEKILLEFNSLDLTVTKLDSRGF